MDEPKNKEQVLDAIRTAHEDMVRLIAGLSESERTAPVLEDNWSVKDHLAHINAWENMMIGWIEASRRGENVVRFAPGYTYSNDAEAEAVMHRLNDHLRDENRDRPWEAVLSDFRATYRRVLQGVDALSDQDILDPNRFAWRQGKPLLALIEGNTYGHYAEHMDWIRKAFGYKL